MPYRLAPGGRHRAPDRAVDSAVRALTALTDEGFLRRRASPYASAGGEDEWATTTAGGALQQASFARPITRRKAETLLNAVVRRAAEYDADAGKPLRIVELRVFGSFLVPDVDELGDLDIALVAAKRTPAWDDSDRVLDYAYATGRRFATIVDALFWPQRELLMHLRARSSYINITTEDITDITTRWRTVYPTG